MPDVGEGVPVFRLHAFPTPPALTDIEPPSATATRKRPAPSLSVTTAPSSSQERPSPTTELGGVVAFRFVLARYEG
jgi:hypothetical protein